MTTPQLPKINKPADLSNRIIAIDKALDTLAKEPSKWVTIAGNSYSLQSIKELRDLRDYTQRKLNEALAVEGYRPRVLMEG